MPVNEPSTAAWYDAIAELEARLLAAWVSGPSFRAAWTPDPKDFARPRHQAIASACAAMAALGVEGDVWPALLDRLASTGDLTRLWQLGQTPLEAVRVDDPTRDLAKWRELRCLFALRSRLLETFSTLTPTTDLATARKAILEAAAQAHVGGAAKTYSLGDGLSRAYQDATNRERAGAYSGYGEVDRATGGIRPGHVWVIGAPTNWGKCLGPETPVLRADGTVVEARAVRAGDYLMGPDSKPRTVVALNAGHAEMFRVTPKRGASWTCNADHILVVADSALGGAVTEISVKDFLNRAPSWRETQKLFHVGVDYPERPPGAVDPWLLGVWFGDGTKSLTTLSVTTPDAEVVSGLREQATLWGLHLREDRKLDNLSATYSLATTHARSASADGNPLLRAVGAEVGNQEGLPIAYTRGSRATRLTLLAGWIDSDGYRKGDRLCEIVTQHETWACELRLLARSLGLQAHIYRKTNVPGYESRVYWRVCITGDLSIVPTRVARKQFPRVQARKHPNRVGFKIEPIGPSDFYGWQLDGDGLFLLGDLTVTHNSSWLLSVADRFMATHGRGVILVTCEDAPELLFGRWLCRRANIRGGSMRDGKFASGELDAAIEAIRCAPNDAPVMLDGRGRSVELLGEDIRSLVSRHGASLVLVDYLQCIATDRDTQDRRAEINHIARTLTDAIKTSGAAGVIASQLTGEDIRESRDVEHAAEVVLIGRKSEEGEMSLFVKKCKTGPSGFEVSLDWDRTVGTFRNTHEEDEYGLAFADQ